MVSIVQNKLQDIIKTCKEMNVQSLYLFGSGAREDDFGPKSDLDFLFSFKSDEGGELLSPYFDYFDLMFKLEEITGKKIDLVAEEKIKNRFFLEELLKDKVQIYES